MHDPRPIIVVPKSSQVSNMVEAAELAIEPRAQRVGIVMILPRSIQPADLMVSGVFWPRLLRLAGVQRVAVVLGVEAWVIAKPVFAACQAKMREQGIEIIYFHEGHLESDSIQAWFDRRRPRRRVTTDMLVKLAERYTARSDTRSAGFALKIAEAQAQAEPVETAATAQMSATAIAKLERSAAATAV